MNINQFSVCNQHMSHNETDTHTHTHRHTNNPTGTAQLIVNNSIKRSNHIIHHRYIYIYDMGQIGVQWKSQNSSLWELKGVWNK